MFNNYNPYYGYIQPQPTKMEFVPPQPQQQPMFRQQGGLQGKSVDSLDVVKAIDIPLDGSVSYFPLTDGSAIVTKQLQQDGTSKTLMYKLVQSEEVNTTSYVTKDDLNNAIKNIDSKELKEIKDDIKSLKKQMRYLMDDKKEE